MKTTNFKLDLMIPNQANKDVVFNESLLTIDNFLSITINGFIDNIPANLVSGEKYIISDGRYKNHICYKTHDAKEIQYFLPNNGMLFFLIEDLTFLLYFGNTWKEVQLGLGDNATPVTNFTPINETFEAENKPYLYLYLNTNATISLEQIKLPETTIIIKQCYNASYSLIWPDNILWENKEPYKVTPSANNIDIVKLYRLPEGTHFIGKIIGQNFQF